jgi:hypothetical protein
MKAVTKICPSCNNEFQAERKNKTYCSDTCRAEVNNEKLRQKMKSIKTLENKSSVGDKYKAAYLSAIRIVKIEYDHNKMSERLTFEGKNFKLWSDKASIIDSLGLNFTEQSAKGTTRTAIYYPKEGFLYLCQNYNYRELHHAVTYKVES